MDPTLDAQRRCLDAWRDACSARPRLHAFQLIALQRERALADDASDMDGYRRRSGDGFELLRAAHLDRLAGSMAVAEAVGECHAAEAARVEVDAALEATGVVDWPHRLQAGALRAAASRERSDVAAGSFARCLLNLLMQHASEPQLADHAGAARAAWNAFAAADPVAAHAAADQPASIDRLALRLPWRGVGLASVRDWLAALPRPARSVEAEMAGMRAYDLDDLPQAWRSRWLDRASADARLPPMPDVAALLVPYRQAAEGRTTPMQVAAVAQRALACADGAGDAPELQRRLIEQRIPAALAAAIQLPQLDAIEARQSVWHEPFLARHANGLRAALAAARTPTEVELLCLHAQACLAVEADWNRLLMTALLAPLQAAAMVAALGSVAEPGLQRAAQLSHALFGLGPRHLLQSPALANHLAQRLLPGTDETVDSGSWFGEAGRELFGALRGWRAMLQAGGSASDRHALVPACLALLDRLSIAEPPAAERELVLWGQRGRVAHWDHLIATSSRPPLPGWAPQG